MARLSHSVTAAFLSALLSANLAHGKDLKTHLLNWSTWGNTPTQVLRVGNGLVLGWNDEVAHVYAVDSWG